MILCCSLIASFAAKQGEQFLAQAARSRRSKQKKHSFADICDIFWFVFSFVCLSLCEFICNVCIVHVFLSDAFFGMICGVFFVQKHFGCSPGCQLTIAIYFHKLFGGCADGWWE